MIWRKVGMMALAAALAAALAGPAQAGPPVGEAGPWWYEGVWRASIDESCFRHTDGRPVNMPEETLYMVLRLSDPVATGGDSAKPLNGLCEYQAEFYLDKALQRQVGGGCFAFDWPPDGETYLIDGNGFKEVWNGNRLWGYCRFELQGVVSTAVRQARDGMSEAEIRRLRQRSQWGGWNIAWCDQFLEPAQGEKRPSGPGHKCRSHWNAEWLRELPDDEQPPEE
jgi:hypothetical protein